MNTFFKIIVLLIISAFASCKKDYTCVCKDAAGFTWQEYSILHKTEKKAKAACSEHDEELTSVAATCELE